MTFQVGQKVVCIKYDPADIFGAPPVKVGDVYTVTWTGVSDFSGKQKIDLLEYPLPETDRHYRGYAAHHFRPVVERKTSIEIFTRMLAPKKQGVRA